MLGLKLIHVSKSGHRCHVAVTALDVAQRTGWSATPPNQQTVALSVNEKKNQ